MTFPALDDAMPEPLPADVQRVLDAAVHLVMLRDKQRAAQRAGQLEPNAAPLKSAPPRAVFTEARSSLDAAVHAIEVRS